MISPCELSDLLPDALKSYVDKIVVRVLDPLLPTMLILVDPVKCSSYVQKRDEASGNCGLGCQGSALHHQLDYVVIVSV